MYFSDNLINTCVNHLNNITRTKDEISKTINKVKSFAENIMVKAKTLVVSLVRRVLSLKVYEFIYLFNFWLYPNKSY